jgi:hypothetical protein
MGAPVKLGRALPSATAFAHLQRPHRSAQPPPDRRHRRRHHYCGSTELRRPVFRIKAATPWVDAVVRFRGADRQPEPASSVADWMACSMSG